MQLHRGLVGLEIAHCVRKRFCFFEASLPSFITRRGRNNPRTQKQPKAGARVVFWFDCVCRLEGGFRLRGLGFVWVV